MTSAEKSNPELLNVLAAFENKLYVGWVPPPAYAPRMMQWYKQSFGRDGITYSDVYREAKSGRLMATMARPIHGAGTKNRRGGHRQDRGR